MYCSYALQISPELRISRSQHRLRNINKLRTVQKHHRSQTEALMRQARQSIIREAMEFRRENGLLDPRSESYYHRLQAIDEEDEKGGLSVAYVRTTDDD